MVFKLRDATKNLEPYYILVSYSYCFIIGTEEQVKEQPGQVNSMSVKLSVMYRVTQYRVCSTLLHVVDVNWRLDYHVKVGVVTMDHMILHMYNNHLERINKPVYLIDLKCSNPEGGGA